jgi:hypothetical protein
MKHTQRTCNAKPLEVSLSLAKYKAYLGHRAFHTINKSNGMDFAMIQFLCFFLSQIINEEFSSLLIRRVNNRHGSKPRGRSEILSLSASPERRPFGHHQFMLSSFIALWSTGIPLVIPHISDPNEDKAAVREWLDDVCVRVCVCVCECSEWLHHVVVHFLQSRIEPIPLSSLVLFPLETSIKEPACLEAFLSSFSFPDLFLSVLCFLSFQSVIGLC